jgi:site-specific DNA-methyltransferase (adenine-specific)
MIETNKFYNADCLDILKDLPDKSVDLVLTDPPYGINENNNKNLSRGKLAKPKSYNPVNFDNKIPDKIYFNEIKRISKNQIIWGGNYFINYLTNTSCFLVWDKRNGNNDFADCELAWTSFKTAVRKFEFLWAGFLQGNMRKKENRFHLTQKPVKLFEWCLINYSNENDLILDCFSGSGTTAIACHNLNRRFICIEKDKEYYEKSVLRYENHIKQLKLIQ